MTESKIDFKRNGKPHSWTVIHNLDEYKIDIMNAFESWIHRFETFDIDDFCDYVVSKDRINFVCMPKDAMSILNYTLKKKWFDMTKSGEKQEEYREIKSYWVRRLCDDHEGCIGGDSIDPDTVMAYTFKTFTHAKIRHGYASDAPTILKKIQSIAIDTGNPEWGAEPGKKYFVIKYKD